MNDYAGGTAQQREPDPSNPIKPVLYEKGANPLYDEAVMAKVGHRGKERADALVKARERDPTIKAARISRAIKRGAPTTFRDRRDREASDLEIITTEESQDSDAEAERLYNTISQISKECLQNLEAAMNAVATVGPDAAYQLGLIALREGKTGNAVARLADHLASYVERNWPDLAGNGHITPTIKMVKIYDAAEAWRRVLDTYERKGRKKGAELRESDLDEGERKKFEILASRLAEGDLSALCRVRGERLDSGKADPGDVIPEDD